MTARVSSASANSPDPALRAIAEASGAAMIVATGSTIAFATGRFLDLLGLSLDEIVGRPLAELAQPDSRALVERRLTEASTGPSSPRRDLVRLATKAGLVVPTEMVTSTIEGGTGPLVLVTFNEASGMDAIARLVLAENWTIVEANQELARMLGLEQAEQARGRSFVEFCPDRILLDRLLVMLRTHGKPSGCELELTDAHGGSFGAVVILHGDLTGPAFLVRGMVVGATEVGYLRRSLLGAQRMEAIGRLAGGIAHDFNNLLTVIGGHADRLVEELPADRSLRSSAAAIQGATRRAASLTRQLLAFGRRQVLRAQPIALHRLTREMEATLANALGPGISLRLEAPSEMPDVGLDPSQFQDALVSLMANAREAMPHGGRVTIQVDAISVDAVAPAPRPWIRPGSYARVTVEDTGRGIAPVTQAHLFEPFFTTKSLGQGAGLGLATVYGFVKQSNGYIFVDSEIDRGASFSLLFPIVASQAGGDDGAAAGLAVFETVFIVEREEQFRTLLADSLRRLGYLVLDAPPGDRAVQVLSACTSRVHLLLADSSVLSEPGHALVNSIRTINPLVQVLHMLESSVVRGLPPRAGRPYVEKPFSLETLAEAVRHVLDTGEGRGWSTP